MHTFFYKKVLNYIESLMKISNHRCEFQQKFLWYHECFNTITQETQKISKIYNKIHDKVYKKLKYFITWHIKPKNMYKFIKNNIY